MDSDSSLTRAAPLSRPPRAATSTRRAIGLENCPTIWTISTRLTGPTETPLEAAGASRVHETLFDISSNCLFASEHSRSSPIAAVTDSIAGHGCGPRDATRRQPGKRSCRSRRLVGSALGLRRIDHRLQFFD